MYDEKTFLLKHESFDFNRLAIAKAEDMVDIICDLIDSSVGVRTMIACKLNNSTRTRNPIKVVAEILSGITNFAMENVLIAMKDAKVYTRIMTMKIVFADMVTKALLNKESEEYKSLSLLLGNEETYSIERNNEDGSKERTISKAKMNQKMFDTMYSNVLPPSGTEISDSVQIPINFNETIEALNDAQFEILTGRMKNNIERNLTKSQANVLLTYRYSKNKRIHVLDGCVRAGKSYISTYMALLDIEDHINSKNPGAIIFVGTSATALYTNVFKGIINEIFKLDIPAPQSFMWRLAHIEIKIFGSNRESMRHVRGISARRIFIDEAQNVLKDDFSIRALETRMASKEDLKIIMTCNTGAPSHPLYAKYLKNPDLYKDLRLERHRFNLETEVAQDNPHIDPRFLTHIATLFGKDSAIYKKEILGEWVGADEAVYTFSEERDVFNADEINLDFYDDIYVGVDQGGSSPKVYIMIGVYIDMDTGKKKIDVLDELYYKKGHNKQTTFRQYVNDLHKFIAPIRRKLRSIYTPHDANDLRMFIDEEMKLPCVLANQKTRVVEGIGMIQHLLLAKHLRISSKCENLIREMQMYQYETKDEISTDNPKKENDHAPDALRYAITSCGVFCSGTYELFKYLTK